MGSSEMLCILYLARSKSSMSIILTNWSFSGKCTRCYWASRRVVVILLLSISTSVIIFSETYYSKFSIYDMNKI